MPACLCNSGIAPRHGELIPRLPATHDAVAPSHVLGAQAFLHSRACARHRLEHWESLPFNQDNRRAQPAAQLGPVLMHIPSLVQHAGEQSLTRHDFHRAVDFDPGFGG